MLNSTIVSGIRSLSNVFATQIGDTFQLQTQYIMFINMIINELSNSLIIDENIAMFFIYFLIFLLSLYYLEKKFNFNIFDFIYNLPQNLGFSSNFCKCRFNQNGQKIIIVSNPKEISNFNTNLFIETPIDNYFKNNEKYLVDFPKINWVISPFGGSLKTDVKGDFLYDETNNDGLDNCYLIDFGSYKVNIRDEIIFDLHISMERCQYNSRGEDRSKTYERYQRKLTLTFKKGNYSLFKDEIVRDRSTIRLSERYHNNNGDRTYRISSKKSEKYNPNVWKGYFHPRKTQLIDWCRQVDDPVYGEKYERFNQHRQLSIICWGEPGTGKSSLGFKICEYTQRHLVSVDLTQYPNKTQLLQIFINPYVNGSYVHPSQVVFLLDEFDKTVKKITLLNKKKEQKEKMKMDILEKSISNPFFNFSSKASVFGDLFDSKGTETFKDDSKKDDKKFDDDEAKIKDDEEEKDDKKDKGDKKKGDDIESKKIIDNLNKENEEAIADLGWNLDDLLSILCGAIIPSGRIVIATANDISQIRKYCPALLRPGRLSPIHFDFGNSKLFCEIVKEYSNIEINEDELPVDYRFMHSSLIEFLIAKRDITKEYIMEHIEIFRPDYIGMTDFLSDVSSLSSSSRTETKSKGSRTPSMERLMEEMMEECD